MINVIELGGGVTSYSDLTDKTTVDLPIVNTPLAAALNGKENTVNKKTDVNANKTSDTFFPTVKAVFDWVTGLFVKGAASSVDNALVRWDGVGGKTVQNSNVIIDDVGNIQTPGAVNQFNGEIRTVKFKGLNRNKTFLLFSFPLAAGDPTISEVIDFTLHDTHDYDSYSRAEVFINRDGSGIANEVGLSTSPYKVRIKTYSDGTTVSVYAVTDNFCDIFMLSVNYNRTNVAFNGLEVGDNTYTPVGVLIFDSTSANNLWHYGTPSHPKTVSIGGGALMLNGGLKDAAGNLGGDGQVLKKVGGLVLWSNP